MRPPRSERVPGIGDSTRAISPMAVCVRTRSAPVSLADWMLRARVTNCRVFSLLGVKLLSNESERRRSAATPESFMAIRGQAGCRIEPSAFSQSSRGGFGCESRLEVRGRVSIGWEVLDGPVIAASSVELVASLHALSVAKPRARIMVAPITAKELLDGCIVGDL